MLINANRHQYHDSEYFIDNEQIVVADKLLDLIRGGGGVILKFWPWSWSIIFDHLTMTPGRRPNGQKIKVILPPPRPPLINNLIFLFSTIYWVRGNQGIK